MRNNPRSVITHTPVHREKILAQHDIRRVPHKSLISPFPQASGGKLENAKWKAESAAHDMETGYLHNVQYLLAVCGSLL